MPSPHERRRNNIRTGIFVSVALILAALITMLLTDWWEKYFVSKEHYAVVYPVSVGVKDLKKGSDVRIGGMNMGQVESVTTRKEDEALKDIRVAFALDKDVKLYQGAKIYVMGPLIGSGAWLEIPCVGDSSAEVPLGHEFTGAESESVISLLSNPDHPIIRNTTEFTGFLAQMPQKYDQQIAPIFADVQELTRRVVHDDWPLWAFAVDQIMVWALELTDDLDAAVADGRSLLKHADTVVVENREGLGLVVDNLADASDDVKELTAHVNAETIAKVDTLLTRAQTGLDGAIAAVETLRTDYEGWAADLGEVLTNGHLASQQLKLALIEVRRSPWKVLYRPTKDELQHELLYEATRSFAVAAADLKAAAASANRILENHGDELRADQTLVDAVSRNLLEPLERYERAQQRLTEVLFDDGS